jgi:two-component system sensor histidine kinase VicK
MTTINCSFKSFRCLFYGLGNIFLLIFLFFIIACQQKKADEAGYSDAFKPVFNKTSVYFGTNKVEQGLHYLDSSMSRISKPAIDDRFRTEGFHFVYWTRTKGDYKKALLIADTMLSLANQSVTQQQYVANYAEANFAKGDSYFNLEQYSNAYQNYFKGYTIAKNNLNDIALSDYTYRMGMIMYKMQNYKLATGYFKECYRLSSKAEDVFSIFFRNQEVLDNIALSYKHNNQPDSALLYFNEALKFIGTYGPRFKDRLKMMDIALGVVYGNKAEVLITKDKYNEAADLLKKSVSINFKKDYDPNDAELAEIKLATLYYNNKKDDALFSLLKTMHGQLDTVKNSTAEADWNHLMSKYYLRKKDLQKAFDYLQVYNNLNESNLKKLYLLKESDVNKQWDSYDKQYQIDSLKDHDKLQTIYLYVAIICALMALIIIFLIFRNWRRSKHDIRVVNALKADMEKTLEELKTSSLEKDRILRTVAHDLRNPIGGIAALTNAMADDNYTDDQKELLNLIEETSHNSLELINEILEVTNNGLAQVKKELVEINSLSSRSVELLRFKAAEKDQQIKLELLSAPVELLISREKIWRVISNLISNAIKFSPSGSTINVKIAEHATDIEILVKDAGIGIPEGMKDKVFNMFTEAKRPGTAGEKSFGLGLSISKQIIENHNGKIWFESNPGSGITFHIKLPKPLNRESTLLKDQRTTSLTV